MQNKIYRELLNLELFMEHLALYLYQKIEESFEFIKNQTI